MEKGEVSEGATHKETRVLSPLVGYHDLCALNGTKTSLGILAVQLSPQEPKKCYGLNRYKHTRDSSMKGPKDWKRHGLHLALIHLP